MAAWTAISRWIGPSFEWGDVIHAQRKLAGLNDRALRDRCDDLQDRRLGGSSESELTVDAFAAVSEAARRRLGWELRENQLRAAWHLLRREIVELPTGEGKTLAATPALALRAFAGRGVWLATSNDYLARRDAIQMEPLFAQLGLSTGFVQATHLPEERREAYACDITYGTIREFGFDFLRDRLSRRRGESTIQRERFSLVVDEADSILLDDARTPLIISEEQPHRTDADIYRWSVEVGRLLREETDYLLDPRTAQIWLTESGRAAIRRAAPRELLQRVSLPEAYESVARAIHAEQTFRVNRDYVVRRGNLVVVDRPTGRLAEGRQWPNGVQQSLQAANGVEITPEIGAVAQMTVQSFLRGFHHLSGMTGTAQEAAREMQRQFGLNTVVIPPHRPCQRVELPAIVAGTRSEKWDRVMAAVRALHSSQRPILIGTRDLRASEELSERLRDEAFTHQVLTARQEAEEAALIAGAGARGAITVATNIAGRGTDIRLDPGVAEWGGLHVIAADLFDAARIDRQLAGRGGRQGDPASYQKILSLADDILPAAWDEPTCQRRVRAVQSSQHAAKLSLLRDAQRDLERQHAKARTALLAHDQDRRQRYQSLGLDPCLDDPES